MDRRPALEQDDARQARRRGDAPLPRRGPLRPREDQEAHRRVRRRAQARGQQEGADPLLHRPARRRQDVARSVDRALDGAPLPPHRARRRARRGRDPRPPAHLRGRAARADPPGAEEGRRQEPGHRARRGRQDGRRHAGRPGGGAARGARPRAELDLPGPLPRRAVRSLAGHVPLHREQPGHDPGAADGPHGGHRVPRVHAHREARHRARVPRAPSSSARTASPTSASSSAPRASSASSTRYTREAGVREPRARDRRRSAGTSRCGSRKGETSLNLVADAEAVEKILGAPRFLPDLAERTSAPGVATGLAWTPSGGDILFIEATKMPGKGEVARHGQPEERDERERGDGRLVRAQPRQGPRPRSGVPQGDRSAPARAQGRDAQGRSERRRHDVQRGRVAAPPVRR